MPRNPAVSHDLLTAALAGLEQQKNRIEQHIAEVRGLLGNGPKRRGRPRKNQAMIGGGEAPAPAKKSATKKRRLSPEGRARIAEAAKRRWAAARKAKA